MTVFRVWAPKAKKMQLELPSGIMDMKPGEGGWFRAEADTGSQPVDYAFRIDGKGPIPDPRSPFQPYGVLGKSRTVDHGAFQWTDQHFNARPLSSALFYELHIGTFTEKGTFASAIEKLDYLVDLGVTHVEIMPVAEFPGKRGWGYDGVDLFAPHHHYGGPDGLKTLVNACHERGLAVILDVIYNHVGPTGNFLDRFAPYFMEEYQGRWGKPFNFGKAHCDEVRRFLVDNIRMWLTDYHFDGLRLDAVHVMFDFSALHILEEMNVEADQIEAHTGRQAVMIAESDANDPRMVIPREANGLGFDAQWIDDFHHALHALLTGQTTGYFTGFGSIATLVHTMTRGFFFTGQYCPHRFRRHGRPVVGLSADKFIGFMQNHDQVGNRYLGDRSAHFLSPGRARIAAAIVLTSPFIPMLFMGEEWASTSPFLYFTDHEDPELAKAVSLGRQRDFEKIGWDPELASDPQDPHTMEKSRLRWEELDQTPHREMLQWHKALIRLRKTFPELTDGRFERVQAQFDEQAQWLAFRRGNVRVVANFSLEEKEVPLQGPWPRDLLAASEDEVAVHESRIVLPPESVAILGPQKK